MFFFNKENVKDIINETMKAVALDSENKFEAMHKKFRTIESLEQEISRLKIEKSQFEEEMAKREREVTHKLGLERLRQEQDIKNHEKEMELKLREKNISYSETKFKEQMEFQTKVLEEKIASLNVLVEKVFEKIPEVKHETKTIIRDTPKRISGRR